MSDRFVSHHLKLQAAKLLRNSGNLLTCPLFSECFNDIGDFSCSCVPGTRETENGYCQEIKPGSGPAIPDLSETQIFTKSDLQISTSGYPYSYGKSDRETTEWVIKVPGAVSYEFEILEFDLDQTDDGCDDYVEFEAQGKNNIFTIFDFFFTLGETDKMRIDLCHGIARASYLRKKRETENHSPVQGKKIRIYDSSEISIKMYISPRKQHRGKGECLTFSTSFN